MWLSTFTKPFVHMYTTSVNMHQQRPPSETHLFACLLGSSCIILHGQVNVLDLSRPRVRRLGSPTHVCCRHYFVPHGYPRRCGVDQHQACCRDGGGVGASGQRGDTGCLANGQGGHGHWGSWGSIGGFCWYCSGGGCTTGSCWHPCRL